MKRKKRRQEEVALLMKVAPEFQQYLETIQSAFELSSITETLKLVMKVFHEALGQTMSGHKVVAVCEERGEVVDLSRRYMSAFLGRIPPELAPFFFSERAHDVPHWLREVEEELDD